MQRPRYRGLEQSNGRPATVHHSVSPEHRVIVKRLRDAKGSDFLKEIKDIPELKDVVSPETAKALQGLNPSELALAKKGIIEALDTAPALAEETLKNLQTEMTALERDVQATTSAQQLESVLAQGTKTADPQRLVTAAGGQAVEKVVQSRVSKLADLSVQGVKQDLLGSMGTCKSSPIPIRTGRLC